MNGFIFRVCAYHGEPVAMNGHGVYARMGLGTETPIRGDSVINDPDDPVIKDAGDRGRESDYDIVALVEDFEGKHGCKVNYDFDLHDKPPQGDTKVFEFDIFEPAWSNELEAKVMVDDLSTRLRDWVEGFPTGRRGG